MNDVKSSKVTPGQLAVWWIGQAGYIIKTSTNKVIFIDPFLVEGSFRMVPPPLEPEQIECSLYICTHNHGDHTDLKSISRILRKEEMTFIGPKNVVKRFLEAGIRRENIHEVNVGDFIELEGIKIRGTFCIPTDDTVLDTEGFLIQTEDGISVYHSGDTAFHYFLFYLSKYPIDIMMVCINGGMGNMNIEEAVQLTRLLRPKVVIPNHYGMFANNTADPVLFRTRLRGTGAEPLCEILKMGEKYVYIRK
jgi:L-ascorbate 6-phosphate lactonase